MGDVIALAQGYLEIANLMIRVKAVRINSSFASCLKTNLRILHYMKYTCVLHVCMIELTEFACL